MLPNYSPGRYVGEAAEALKLGRELRSKREYAFKNRVLSILQNLLEENGLTEPDINAKKYINRNTLNRIRSLASCHPLTYYQLAASLPPEVGERFVLLVFLPIASDPEYARSELEDLPADRDYQTGKYKGINLELAPVGREERAKREIEFKQRTARILSRLMEDYQLADKDILAKKTVNKNLLYQIRTDRAANSFSIYQLTLALPRQMAIELISLVFLPTEGDPWWAK